MVIDAVHILEEFFNFNSLRQIVTVKNSCGNMLNLALTNICDIDSCACDDYLLTPEVYHSPLEFRMSTISLSYNVYTDSSFNFYKADYLSINKCLSEID